MTIQAPQCVRFLLLFTSRGGCLEVTTLADLNDHTNPGHRSLIRSASLSNRTLGGHRLLEAQTLAVAIAGRLGIGSEIRATVGGGSATGGARAVRKGLLVLLAAAVAFTLLPRDRSGPNVSLSHAIANPLQEGRRARSLNLRDYLRVYGINELHSRGLNGEGVTVVVPAIDTYQDSDLDRFRKRYGLPPFDIVEVGDSSSDLALGEVPMDLQIIHAVAPQARLVVAHWPLSARDNPETIERVARRFPGAVWSWSIGWCEEGDPGLARDAAKVLARTVARGAVHFAASGDSGGYDCYPQGKLFDPPRKSFIGLIMPASAPAVTAVGGTRVLADKRGNLLKETPWYRSVTLSGSGGGTSEVFDGRTVPDVAGDADPTTGMAFFFNGEIYSAGGTSASAPLWAGLGALVEQALREQGVKREGDFNSLLASIAKAAPEAFRHPRVGSNAVALAEDGRDQVTGWGAPNAQALVEAAMDVSR